MRRIHAHLPALLALVALPLGGCDDGGFTQLPEDAGPGPAPDAGPGPAPPPEFPLKAGDKLEVPVLNAQLNEGAACSNGACDRTLRADYEIVDVYLNADTNRWALEAEYVYTMTKNGTSYESVDRLIFSKAGPFGDLNQEGTSDNGQGFFLADEAPTAALEPNGFPFFHYEPAYANRPDSAWQVAAFEFADVVQAHDADANITSQAADATIGAYWKDELGGEPVLHKPEVKYHPMGMICGWEERMVPWEDGMNRAESGFSGKQAFLQASYQTVRLRRDTDATPDGNPFFTCSCTAQETSCYAVIEGERLCLDPYDHDAQPSNEACSAGNGG